VILICTLIGSAPPQAERNKPLIEHSYMHTQTMPEEHGKMKQVRFRLLFSKYIKPVTELVEIVKGIKEAQPPPPPPTHPECETV